MPESAIFNAPPPAEPSPKPWFEFRNLANASEPAEILIYEQIGQDHWSGEGIGAKDFVEQLKAIPANRKITLRINSPGGNVWDGLAIYNQLKARREFVTAVIDGIAASVASWLPLAAKEVQMPKSALFMIHDPWSLAIGTADEMRKAADSLDKHKAAIVDIYREKTGKPRAEIERKMTEETWFTGDEAKEFGLADTLLDTPNIQNSFDLSRFRRVPESLRNHQNSAVPSKQAGKQENTMNRKEIIALLNKHGVTVDDKLTDEQVKNLLEETLAAKNKQPESKPQPSPENATLEALQNELKSVREERERERKNRIASVVDVCITENRIPANDREKYVNLCVKDESFIDTIKNFPQKPADEPTPRIQADAGPLDTLKHIKNLNGAEKSAFIRKHYDRIVPVLNTNTIATEFKRDVLLDSLMRAFKKRMIALGVFSTKFENVPLQTQGGTAKVQVPFLDLETATSTDFDAEDGYVTGDTTLDNREVTINKRKYQGLSFTSSEFRRQPYLLIEQLMGLKVEKLALDVLADVLTLVTNANYGAAVKTSSAANFDSDDLADLKTAADDAEWPEVGRGLMLDTAYDNYIMKDDAYKLAINSMSTDVLRRGTVGPVLYGFDYIPTARIPANGENLEGIMFHKSAILVATAPIEPTAEVRAQLSAYSVIVDADCGLAFEYRSWGDPNFDESKQIVEVNYGYNVGNASALKRIVSA
jgi:ATP-dependent Clp endopeptidase proteolytic subunit ClpP